MNYKNLVRRKKEFVCAVATMILSACGGGDEAFQSEQVKSIEIGQAIPAEDDEWLQASLSVPPSAAELEFDQEISDTFLASMKNNEGKSTTEASGEPLEKSMALHRLNGMPGEDSRVKFNPGHYIAVPRPNDDEIRATLKQIEKLPHVKGILVRYSWKQLEPRKDDYDFSAIDRDLSLIASESKRLFIMVYTKDFERANAIPEYLRSATYAGGSYRTKVNGWHGKVSYGENVALYNDNVRDRLIALTKALGNRYNRHNKVEGLTFNETALGQAINPLSASQEKDWFANLAQVNKEANKAFPNTVVMQFINFPRNYVGGLVHNMLSNGVALGGPDTFFHDEDLNRYVYPHYDTAKGKVAIGPSVQPENYMTTSHNGRAPAPSVQSIYTFAKDKLHANYLFWTKYNPTPLKPYDDAIQMFNSPSFPKDGAGGLNRNCPSAYVSCVSEL